MTEYITKEQALNAVTSNLDLYGDEWIAAYNIVGAIPAADVAPVVHARWEVMRDPYGEIEGFLCSCGHESLSASNYCPECGARMVGE